MNFSRRQFLYLGAGAAALPFTSHVACAQTYPARPVRLIAGFAPGGSVDITARLIGLWLSERLGRPFVIENRPGAGSSIATEAVVRAPADGYTLLLITSANSINATLYENLNFNFIRDIAPIAGIMRVPNVLEVNLSVPAKNVPELIAYAKANPGKLNIATVNGTTLFVAGELFKMMAGVNMLQVPYRGTAAAMTNLLSGEMQVMFDTMPASIEHIRAGRLRPLAVTTETPSAALPGVPTVSDFMQGYEASTWYGIGAPKSTPAEVIEMLNREINTILASPKAKEKIAELGGTPLFGSPVELSTLITDETEKWAKVIKFSGAKPD